jgi:hypothetical protein
MGVSQMLDSNYYMQQVMEPEYVAPQTQQSRRVRANSRRMMDGNENLLENDTSRQDVPNDNLAAMFGSHHHLAAQGY